MVNVEQQLRNRALMAASCDPIHRGHIRVIERALTIFPSVTLGIGHNPSKPNKRFPIEERVEMARSELASFGARVDVQPFEGFAVDFAHAIQACCLVRGVRSQTDMDAENQMARVNKTLHQLRYGVPLETIQIWADEDLEPVISSSLVMQLLEMNCSEAELAKFVPASVLQALLKKRQQT